MWVHIYAYAEIVALDSFGVGDRVAFSCRSRPHHDLDLPPGIDRAGVLLEDADYGIGPDGDDDSFVEVSGRVTSIMVARDTWRKIAYGGHEPVPGTRTWRNVDNTRDGRATSPDADPTAYLVHVETG